MPLDLDMQPDSHLLPDTLLTALKVMCLLGFSMTNIWPAKKVKPSGDCGRCPFSGIVVVRERLYSCVCALMNWFNCAFSLVAQHWSVFVEFPGHNL